MKTIRNWFYFAIFEYLKKDEEKEKGEKKRINN